MNIILSKRCDVHGCTVKKPFNSIEDRQAHFTTTHKIHRPNHCPIEECTRHSNGFTTLGKLVEHIKVEHDPPKCTFDHCDFRSLGNVMVGHVQRMHRQGNGWECKLPGCEGSKSGFTYDRFRSHVFSHGIGNWSYSQLWAVDRGDKSFILDGTFVTCKHCSESRAPSGQNEASKDGTA
ncbi:uncharacterized protein LY89DRAFT_216975 [Mollisia scopiformis]|uniref:C2H2-type domain-containing protein n=1 Tax=Mollisia scopiformis TaxID=149040 RepID=A0A194WVF9_MOLSC|nr:uncharacterized protein LY89DRAFT_216975 [Mollisia scopiformis]KUJ11953.1 hypothetical protein LY89DRAFT_216975 [Mollisia scopiformis]